MNIYENKTEEELACMEEEIKRQTRIKNLYRKDFSDQIDDLLRRKQWDQLSSILRLKENRDKFENDSEIVYMILANEIYLSEMTDDVEHKAFDDCSSIQDVVELLRSVKFCLWHDPKAGEEIFQLFNQRKISNCLLKYMIYTSVMDKMSFLKRFSFFVSIISGWD